MLNCIEKFGKQSAIDRFGIDVVNTIAPNAPDRIHVEHEWNYTYTIGWHIEKISCDIIAIANKDVRLPDGRGGYTNFSIYYNSSISDMKVLLQPGDIVLTINIYCHHEMKYRDINGSAYNANKSSFSKIHNAAFDKYIRSLVYTFKYGFYYIPKVYDAYDSLKTIKLRICDAEVSNPEQNIMRVVSIDLTKLTRYPSNPDDDCLDDCIIQ